MNKFCVSAAVLGALFPASASGGEISSEATRGVISIVEPAGRRYEADVPATLDLALRAELAVQGLTRFLDARFAPYNHAYFNVNPAFMTNHYGQGHQNWGKVAESLALARLMSGSRANLDIEKETFNGMIDFSNSKLQHDKLPTPISRVMLALMHVYHREPNEELKRLIGFMVDVHREHATIEAEHAYYWDGPPDERDTQLGVNGYLLQVFVNGTAIRALTRWHQISGDEESIALAGKLAAFLVQPKYWQPECEPKAVTGSDHAQFAGHIHACTQGLMGLLCYAEATNDARLQQFVREGYEFIRTFGIARLGLFGEMCTTGDMTYLAIRMSDMGVGDYWEDADQYVRNHLTELQIQDVERLQDVVDSMPKLPDPIPPAKTSSDPVPPETTEDVVRRHLGTFFGDATHPTKIPPHTLMRVVCCTGNCTPALYFAWESIVRCENGAAQVNLLLNRASPWLDLESHLPYEGKAVARIKTAERLALRVPRWAERESVRAKVNGREVALEWLGRFLVFRDLAPNDVVTVQFPMIEATEAYTLKWKQSDFWFESNHPGRSWQPAASPVKFRCRFRGNTLVDVSPRAEGPGYALYLRSHYESDTAPRRSLTRFVPNSIYPW